jgi:hypothetical protein
MRKLLPLALAVLLGGCANMEPQDRRMIGIIGGIAGAALLVSMSKDDEDEPSAAAKCTTVIRPSAGGGISTNATFCP